MLKRKKKQLGVSFINVIVWIFFIGIIGIYGLQIAGAYFDKSTIESSVTKILQDDLSPSETKVKIINTINMNNIDIMDEDVIVERVGQDTIVNIAYNKEINITDKIKLLINLDISKESNKN